MDRDSRTLVACCVLLAVAAAVRPLPAAGSAPGPASVPATAAAADSVTAEELAALLPERLGGLERASIRPGYRPSGHPYVEAEYGGGAEGPMGAAGRSGGGVSVQAGLLGPDEAPKQMIRYVPGTVADTTYRGHEARRLGMGTEDASGMLVVLDGSPRAAVLVVSQGTEAPEPGAALDEIDLERLAALAARHRE